MGYLVIFIFALLVALIVTVYQIIITSKIRFPIKIVLSTLLTFSIMLGSYIREKGVPSDAPEQRILSPLAGPIVKGIETVRHVIRSKEIEQIIKEETDKYEGDYAVAIKNLKTGEEYFLNENKRFSSASLYKLWVMGEVFDQIEDGKFNLETKLSDSVEALNKRFGLASESAELKDGTISRTVETALEDMITVSANYPAYLLTSKVGSKNIRQFLADNGLSDSNVGTLTTEPYTTALNIFSLYEKLYKKELVSRSSSEQMLEILKRQTINDRIPKYLPKKTVIAHKTGELFGNKHNAGIVYSDKGDYIIVLMSKTKSEVKAAEVEAQISKRVWEYFNK